MEIFNEVITTVIVGVIAVLTPYLIQLIKNGFKLLSTKTANTALQTILYNLDTFTEDAVKFVEATLVTAAKADGTWDSEAKLAAFQIAYNNIVAKLGEDAMDFISDHCGDVATIIKDKIEAVNKDLISDKK